MTHRGGHKWSLLTKGIVGGIVWVLFAFPSVLHANEEIDPPKIDVAGAMCHLQQRFVWLYDNTTPWPACLCGCEKNGPDYPSGKYYEDDLEIPSRACQLVQVVADTYDKIYINFMDVDHWDNRTLSPPGYPSSAGILAKGKSHGINLEVLTIDGQQTYSYAVALGEILQYIVQLQYTGGPGPIPRPLVRKLALGGGTSFSEALGNAFSSYTDNQTGWYSWDYDPIRKETESFWDGFFDFYSVNLCHQTGYIDVDMTAYTDQKYESAKCYGQCLERSSLCPDGVLTGFSVLNDVPLGTFWQSDNITFLCSADDVIEPAENERTYYRYELWGSFMILKAKFKDVSPSKAECGGGCPCSSCSPGGSGPKQGSVDLRMNLGKLADGKPAGMLYICEERPRRDLSMRSRLMGTFADAPNELSVARDYNGNIDTVTAPQTLVQVANSDNTSYTVTFSKVGSSLPYKRYTLANPAEDPEDNFTRLVVTEEASVDGSTFTTTSVSIYDYDNATDAWTFTQTDGNSNPLRRETKSQAWSGDNLTETHTVEGYNPATSSFHTDYREVSVYHKYPWGLERASLTIGAEGQEKITTWDYFDNPTSDNGSYTRLKQTIEPSGRTLTYSYRYDTIIDNLTDNETENTIHLLTGHTISDSCSGIETATDWTVEPYGTGGYQKTILTVQTLDGQEISRHYQVYMGDNISDNETVWDVQCPNSGAELDDSANLKTVTVQYKYTGSSLDGKPLRIERPDGTLTLYNYANYPTTTIVSTGHTSDNATIDNGTETTTTVNYLGGPLSTMVKDIVSGLTISQDNVTDFDEFGRALRTDYLDGTFTATTYDCCGVHTTTDKDNVTTTYTYDALKRLIDSTRLGITTSHTYDAMGRTLTESRTGTDNSTVLLKTYTYDTAGRLTSTTDADNRITTYEETFDEEGNAVKTTTYPDNSTRIETYRPDGKLLSLTGTALHGICYEYGTWDNGTFTKEIKLDNTSQPTSEWVKTYTDMLGQSVKVLYPDNAQSLSYYNALGQLWKQVDSDNVTTLYGYNGKGELVYTAIDMDRNNAIDEGGMDRITRTVTEITSAHNTTVRRTTTTVWPDNGSSTALTVSQTDQSVDGLQSWTMANGITAPTHSATVYDAGNHTRTASVTHPDNTTDSTTYENGRVTQTVRRDAGGVQMARTSYTYDAHGRIDHTAVTDGSGNCIRTTTYSDYDNLDRPLTVTLSASGVDNQTTTYVYDAMGRQVEVDGPAGDNDTGIVYNEYWPTGELKKTYGARTYPVAYTYDYAGRRATMTTYQQADNTTGEGTGGEAVTEWTYDAQRGWLSAKTYEGNTAGPSYTYTPAGRLETRTWARTLGGQSLVTTYGYNNAGDLAGVDYSDNTTDITYQHDRRGRKISVTDAAGTWTLAYDNATGQPAGETVAAGEVFNQNQTMTVAYDVLGRRSRLTTSLALVFKADFNNDGKVDYKDGNIQKVRYGQAGGHSDGDADGDGQVTMADIQIFEKESGLQTAMIEYTDYSYDNASRLSRVQSTAANSSAGTRADFAYLANSALPTTTTYTGSNTYLTVSRSYDNLSRLTAIQSNPSGDPAFRYAYTYNTANQRTGLTLADNSTWSYGYDARGQLASALRTVSGTSPVPGQSFDYAYDAVGNRQRETRYGSTNRTFDYTANALNQYEQRTVPRAQDLTGNAAAGETLTFEVAGSDYPSTRYGPYGYRQWTQVDNTTIYRDGKVKVYPNPPYTLIRDSSDAPDGVSVNGTWYAGTQSPGYYGANYLHDGNTGKGSKSVWYFVPSPMGWYNVFVRWPSSTGQATNTWATVGWNGGSIALNQSQNGGTWNLLGNYKISGARIMESIDIKNQGSDNRCVADAVKFEKVDVKSKPIFIPATPEGYSYDADGNLLADGRWTYTYDAENRLVGMETNPAAASQAPSLPKLRLAFTYDHRGRRVRKQVYGWDNATNDYSTTPGGGAVFLYDDWNLVAELTLDGSRAQRYVWGPDLSGSLQGAGGIGGLLWITRDHNSCKAVVYDGQGNVMGTVYLGAGRTGNRYEYDPYGRLLTSQETYYGVNCPFRFSTKYTDSETGLAYFGYRYYHPDTGRWLNRDPIEDMALVNTFTGSKQINLPLNNVLNLSALVRTGKNGGTNPLDFSTGGYSNQYLYVQNDPVNFIDLLGLMVDPHKECGLHFVEGINPPHSIIEGPDKYWDFGPDEQFMEEHYGHSNWWLGLCGLPGGGGFYCRGTSPWKHVWAPFGIGYGLNKSSRIQAGPARGKRCRCATCQDISSCLDKVGSNWNGTEFNLYTRNCISFVKDAKGKCCLK